jgi:lipid-A-disaccharide synthase
MNKRILITAGEPSGDLHGAHVVSALRAAMPNATIDAVGGPHMAAAGANILHPIDNLGAIGFVEVVHKIPSHLKLLRRLCTEFKSGKYDLLIAVDYPGFHLRVAEAAQESGIPVLGYIAPQLWAWRPGRAKRWAKAVNRLAVILPFETEFFRSHGIESTYVGHPLVDRGAAPDRTAARARLGLGADRRVLALFPGSRSGEVARLWPPYRDAAKSLLENGSIDDVVVAGTSWGDYSGADGLSIVREDPSLVLATADAVLAKSGTTTLEAALANVPMVVAYRAHPITFHVAMKLLTVEHISLVNLIAGFGVVPELKQGEVTTQRLVAELEPLIVGDGEAARKQRKGLELVRSRLGGPGASERVAGIAMELLAV